MKIIEWFRSIMGKGRSTFDVDIELAESLAPIADSFLLPLGIAELDGQTWAAKEAGFMAGYLQGYADVVAQASGRESGSQLGLNIALQFAKRLLKDANASAEDICAFVEFAMEINGDEFDEGFSAGSNDANAFVSRRSAVSMALGKHFGIK